MCIYIHIYICLCAGVYEYLCIFKFFNHINDFMQIGFLLIVAASEYFFGQCGLVSVQTFIGETFCLLINFDIFVSLAPG